MTAELRRPPTQERGKRRVDSLLDAAAALLDEHGIAALTTTDVARRAGTSVGGLYRYFPDVTSLLRALAFRNRQRYWQAALAEAGDARGREFLSSFMQSYVRFARTEPGFRALRFGHVLETYLGEHTTTATVTDELADAIVERSALTVTPELLRDIDVAITMSVALMDRAFELDPQGDPHTIDRTLELAGLLLARHA